MIVGAALRGRPSSQFQIPLIKRGAPTEGRPYNSNEINEALFTPRRLDVAANNIRTRAESW